MSRVWKPQKPPPTITTFSNPETETVWQYLLANYRKERNLGPDPQHYYSTIYQKQFGAAPHSTPALNIGAPALNVKDEPATTPSQTQPLNTQQTYNDRRHHGSDSNTLFTFNQPPGTEIGLSTIQPHQSARPLSFSNIFHVRPEHDSEPRFSDAVSFPLNRTLVHETEKLSAELDDSCLELQFDFEISPVEHVDDEGKDQGEIGLDPKSYQYQGPLGGAPHGFNPKQLQKHHQEQKQQQQKQQQQQQINQQEHHRQYKQQRQQPFAQNQQQLFAQKLQQPFTPNQQQLFAQNQQQPFSQKQQQPFKQQQIPYQPQQQQRPADNLSQDSLDELLASQPLFSQFSAAVNQQQASASQHSIEIVGMDSQDYCSPPLDLSPDNDTFAILSQMAKPKPDVNKQKGNVMNVELDDKNKINSSLRNKGGLNRSAKRPRGDSDLDNVSKRNSSLRNEGGLNKSVKRQREDNYFCIQPVPNTYHEQTFEEPLQDQTFRSKPQDTSIAISTHSTPRRLNILQESFSESREILNKRETREELNDSVTSMAKCASTGRESSLDMSSSSLANFKKSLSDTDKQSSIKQTAGKRFQVPSNKQKQQTEKKASTKDKAYLNQSTSSEKSETSTRGVVCSIPVLSDLGDEEQYEIKQEILGAKEICLTLMYKDGSCQLQQVAKKSQKKQLGLQGEACSLVMGWICQSGKMQCVILPFLEADQEVYSFCRELVEEVMSTSSMKKVCYDGQHIMYSLVHHFNYDHTHVSMSWYGGLEDLRIMGWLLHSDDPPLSFQHLLQLHCKQLIQQPTNRATATNHWLSILGQAYSIVSRRLSSIPSLRALYDVIERPLVPVLAVMELTPVSMDTGMIHNMQGAVQKKLVELEGAAHAAAGQSFSINSHAQLRVILFEKLKLHLLCPGERLASTGTGQHRSTCEGTLSKLEHTHPLPAIILQHRQLQKLKSTYLDGIAGHIERVGELFTHWDHTAAATGRLTSALPNIQSIPKQPVTITTTTKSYIVGQESVTKSTDLLARAPFVSRHGYSFLAADFQQMEFRLFAHLSADPVLLELFNGDINSDVFTQLTAQWKRTTVEEVQENKELREQTKRVVYSVMYGVGKEKLSEYLKTTTDEAWSIMNSFLASFPGVSSFSKRCVQEARQQGYQQSLFGRRRYLPAVRNGSSAQRAQAERQAVNFCVQGSAADLCKAATVLVQKALAEQPTLQARLLFHIHDELLLEVPDHNIPHTAALVRSVMEDTELLCADFVHLSVPLPVSLSVGKSWASLTPYTPTQLPQPSTPVMRLRGEAMETDGLNTVKPTAAVKKIPYVQLSTPIERDAMETDGLNTVKPTGEEESNTIKQSKIVNPMIVEEEILQKAIPTRAQLPSAKALTSLLRDVMETEGPSTVKPISTETVKSMETETATPTGTGKQATWEKETMDKAVPTSTVKPKETMIPAILEAETIHNTTIPTDWPSPQCKVVIVNPKTKVRKFTVPLQTAKVPGYHNSRDVDSPSQSISAAHKSKEQPTIQP